MTADSTASKALDVIVKKDDLRSCKFVPAKGPDQTVLQPGQVMLKVDEFAFTSSNVTYAAFGDVMSYWGFFPAQDGWGRIPVWGFADVVRSEHESIAWREFLAPVAGWMKVVQGRAPAAVERVYLEMLDGRGKPDEGNVLTVFE